MGSNKKKKDIEEIKKAIKKIHLPDKSLPRPKKRIMHKEPLRAMDDSLEKDVKTIELEQEEEKQPIYEISKDGDNPTEYQEDSGEDKKYEDSEEQAPTKATQDLKITDTAFKKLNETHFSPEKMLHKKPHAIESGPDILEQVKETEKKSMELETKEKYKHQYKKH